MAKKKKSSNVFKTARLMGENVGKLVVESKKTIRKGKKELMYTAEKLQTAGKKAGREARTTARTTTQETIPQLVKEFKKGINKGMKKRR